MFQFVATITAITWIAVFALMQLFHALYRTVDFRWRYVQGTATICGGCTVIGLVTDNPALAIVPWALAAAGATVVINYAAEARDAKRRTADRKAGELIGATRGLTQELIDKGGEHATRQPGAQDRSRTN